MNTGPLFVMQRCVISSLIANDQRREGAILIAHTSGKFPSRRSPPAYATCSSLSSIGSACVCWPHTRRKPSTPPAMKKFSTQ